jgi:hypothetical protein
MIPLSSAPMNMIRSDWYTSLQAIRMMPSRFHPWKLYGKCLNIVETLVYKEFPRCMQLQQLPKDTLFAMRFLINDDEVEEEEEEQDLHGRWFERVSDDGRMDSDDDLVGAVDGGTNTTTNAATTTPTPAAAATATDIIGDDDGELIVGAQQLIINDEKANTPKKEQIMKTKREKKKTRRRMNLSAADCPPRMKSTEITVGALVESVLWYGSDDSDDDDAVALEHVSGSCFPLSAITTTANSGGESLSIHSSDNNITSRKINCVNNNCDDDRVNRTRRQMMRNERVMDPYQSHALRIAFSID